MILNAKSRKSKDWFHLNIATVKGVVTRHCLSFKLDYQPNIRSR